MLMKKLIVLIPFIAAALSISVWLCEIVSIDSWQSLQWLHVTLISPYIITLLAALSFIVPLYFQLKLPLKKTIVSVVFLYCVNTVCFYFAQRFFYDTSWNVDITDIVRLLILSIVFSMMHWFIIRKVFKLKVKASIFILVLVPFISMGLSLLTVFICPGFGFQTNFVDAVKMGYPQFFGVLCIGLTSVYFSKQKITS